MKKAEVLLCIFGSLLISAAGFFLLRFFSDSHPKASAGTPVRRSAARSHPQGNISRSHIPAADTYQKSVKTVPIKLTYPRPLKTVALFCMIGREKIQKFSTPRYPNGSSVILSRPYQLKTLIPEKRIPDAHPHLRV